MMHRTSIPMVAGSNPVKTTSLFQTALAAVEFDEEIPEGTPFKIEYIEV